MYREGIDLHTIYYKHHNASSTQQTWSSLAFVNITPSNPEQVYNIYTSLANIGRTIRVTTNIIQSVGQAYYSANTQKQLTWLEQGRHHFASRQLVPTLSNWFTKCTKSLTIHWLFFFIERRRKAFFNEMQPKFFGSMDQLPHNSKCVHRVDGEKNYLTKKWRSRKCKKLTFEKGFKTRNIQFLHVLGHHFFVKYGFFSPTF